MDQAFEAGNQGVICENVPLPLGKKLILGLQHAFTMFGATVLVPLITGLDVSVALFMAGIGTLIFHLITRGRMPVFLGSSFAFIAPLAAATSVSTMFGGPPNTTYSENTGVVALTKVHNPQVMRVAAGFAILMGVVPKLGCIISTIPKAVVGGISVVLFGMIAAIGARSLIEGRIDLCQSRNLIIVAVILVLGLGGAVFPVSIGALSFKIEGMALAAIVGILLKRFCQLKKPNNRNIKFSQKTKPASGLCPKAGF